MAKDTRKKAPKHPIDRLGLVVDCRSEPDTALKFVLIHFKGKGDTWRCYKTDPSNKKSYRFYFYLLLLSGLCSRWFRQRLENQSLPSSKKASGFSLHATDSLYGTMVKYYYDFKGKPGRYLAIPCELREGVAFMFIPKSSGGGGKNSRIELASEVSSDHLHFWATDGFPADTPPQESMFEVLKDDLPKRSIEPQDVDHLIGRLCKCQQWQTWERKAKELRDVAKRTTILARIRDHLRQEALQELLNGRLRSEDLDDYVTLGMQLGELPSPNDVVPHRDNTSAAFPFEHGRVWRRFNPGVLLNPAGQYAISSPVGTGKTTFLRHLQSKMLAPDGPLLAFYLPAACLNGFTKLTWPKLREYLADSLTGILPKEPCTTEFDKAFTDHRFVLLVDGLDQLGEAGLNCSHLVDQIIALANGNPVIIAGRPTAIRWLEHRPSIAILRLEHFDSQAKKQFFGESYDSACRICRHCSDLLAVPMLAYLVRLVAQADKDRGNSQPICSRWDLYSRIVDYIFYEHTSNIQDKNHDEWADGVTEAIGRVAYGAIDRKIPLWSVVPQKVCRDLLRGTALSLDTIPSCGVADMLRQGLSQRAQCLAFGHQSFQEFFAAEWIKCDQQRLEHVLSEYWNPKWHEVIKFLVGTTDGKEVVEKLYPDTGRDTPIHSRLFVASECAGEAGICGELESRLTHNLLALVNRCPFDHDALKALASLGTEHSLQLTWETVAVSGGAHAASISENPDILDALFSEERLEEALSAFANTIVSSGMPAVLRAWVHHCPERIFDALLPLLRHRNERLRYGAAAVLSATMPYVNSVRAHRIWEMLASRDAEDRRTALMCLWQHGDLSPSQISTVIDRLEDADRDVGHQAVIVLLSLSCEFDSTAVQRMTDICHSKNEMAMANAADVLCHMPETLTPTQIERFEGMLNDHNPRVKETSLRMLGAIGKRVSSRTIWRALDLMDDEDVSVSVHAIDTCASRCDALQTEEVQRICQHMTHSNRFVRITTLNAVRYLRERLSPRAIKTIVASLTDPKYCVTAICACSFICDKLTPAQLAQIVDLLPHSHLPLLFQSQLTQNPLSDKYSWMLPRSPVEIVAAYAPYLTDDEFATILKMVTCPKQFGEIETCMPMLDAARCSREDIARITPLLDGYGGNRCVYAKLREIHALGGLEGITEG